MVSTTVISKNVKAGNSARHVTSNASVGLVGTETIRVWVEIANLFEALSRRPLAIGATKEQSRRKERREIRARAGVSLLDDQATLDNRADLRRKYQGGDDDRVPAETMRRFVFEMGEVALSGRGSLFDRLLEWLNNPARHKPLYDVAHLARNLLATAAQWKPELGYSRTFTVAPWTFPAWIALGIDKHGMYSTKEDDLIRDEFLPALRAIPPFSKKTRNAGRIRQCPRPVCGKIYYAVRVDQPTCCKKCAGAWRVSEYRRKEEALPEEVQDQHRADTKIARFLREEGRSGSPKQKGKSAKEKPKKKRSRARALVSAAVAIGR